MARWLHPDGTEAVIAPTNGRSFTLPELYRLLACETVELVRLGDGARVLLVDEDARWRRPRPAPNPPATALLAAARGRPGAVILGPALVCTPDEVGEDEEDLA